MTSIDGGTSDRGSGSWWRDFGPDSLAAAIVTAVLILIVMLTIFVFVQFWYFYVETSTTESKIAEISASYDDKLGQLTTTSLDAAVVHKDEIVKLAFLKEFKNQRAWEQSHERVNRRYFSLASSADWFLKLLVLFLAILNERVTSPTSKDNLGLKRSTIVLVVFFSAMSIAVPAFTQKLGFEARQRLHDFRALQLSFLITEVESGVTDPKSAWLRYQGLYRESPSSYANRPGF